MSDFEKLINASDLIDWIMETYPDWCVGAIRGIVDHIDEMPSAQPEPPKITIDYEPTADELERIKQAMRNTPVMLLPSRQPEIIHCGDCKKCQIDSVFHDYWCDGRKVWKDHYCGYAERRTDE